jgi:hypothetical protein
MTVTGFGRVGSQKFFICIETKIDKFDILNLPDGYSEFSKYRRKHFKKKSGGISELFSKMYLKNVLILLKLTVILIFRLESTLFLKIIIYYMDVYTKKIHSTHSAGQVITLFTQFRPDYFFNFQ